MWQLPSNPFLFPWIPEMGVWLVMGLIPTPILMSPIPILMTGVCHRLEFSAPHEGTTSDLGGLESNPLAT